MPNCSVVGCRIKKSENRPNITLHRLPKNDRRRKMWLDKIGVENLTSRTKTIFVCSLHFDESCFNRTLNITTLREDAVPSRIFLETEQNNSVDEAPSEPPSPPPSPPPSLHGVPRVKEPEMENDIGNWVKHKHAEGKLNLKNVVVPIISNCETTKQTSEILEGVDDEQGERNETVCRICLRSGFERKKGFDEKLMKLHVQLCDYEALAIQMVLAICPVCEHLLRKFYNFKQKCIQANTILKHSTASALEKYGYENLHILIPNSIGLLKPSDRQGIYKFEHITKSFTVFPSHAVKKPVIYTDKLEHKIENLNPVVNLNRETITQNANLNPVVNLNRETITQNANLNPAVNLKRGTITQNANLNPVVNLNRETITQNANLNPAVNLKSGTITQNANLNPVVNLKRGTITQNANLNPVVNLKRGTITQNANLNPVVRINKETKAAGRKVKLNPSIVKLIPEKSKKVNLHPYFVHRKTQDTKPKLNLIPVFTSVSTKHRKNIRFDRITVTCTKKNGMDTKLNPETPNVMESNWEPEVITPDIDQTVIKTEDEDIKDPLLVSNSIDNKVSIDIDLEEETDSCFSSDDEPSTKYRRTDEEIEYLQEEYLDSDFEEIT